MSETPGYILSASSEMLFVDLPHLERVCRIHDLGFAVEIWNWTTKDIDALAATGAHFTSMTGYIAGRLADEAGADEMLQTAEQSVAVAHRLGNPLLNLHGTVVLENLNLEVDHPGVPFARAADVIALVEAVDSPHLRVMLDIYHAQIGEGNLITLIQPAGNLIGEIQVADVPGRCEPGTGEINYPAIARTLIDMGYSGTVGLEGWASAEPTAALDRFRTAFTAGTP
jgi:hydroxypyruvate isomerase